MTNSTSTPSTATSSCWGWGGAGWATTTQVRRIVADLDAVTDVVGISVAEFLPRQVIHPQQLLTGSPLLHASPST